MTREIAVIETYGSPSLVERWNRTVGHLKETEYLQYIWSRSHSDFDWRNLNCHYHSDWKNIRQVAAELSRKEAALVENKYNMLRKDVEIRRFETQIADAVRNNLTALDVEALQIEVACRREQMQIGIRKFEGAMKDVEDLKRIHDELAEKLGEVTEEAFLAHERENHLRRAVVQCVRDVRQHGVITKGEQEYLEDCGANPTKVRAAICVYLREEETVRPDWGTEGLRRFVEDLVREIICPSTQTS